jgi:hypothetical protein
MDWPGSVNLYCKEIRFRAACLNASSTAPVSEKNPLQVRITHPFHPMYDKQFCLIEHRCVFAESVELDDKTVLKGGALAVLGLLPSAQKVLEAVRKQLDKS